MKKQVMLSICGRQAYMDQEPDTIELVTEGSMEFVDGGWNIQYQETELTGLAGVTTTFRVEPEKVILTRTGGLISEMVFQEGMRHESLYQMDFGALLITVCASRIFAQIGDDGGMVDLVYNIDIENNTAGTVDYHLEITPK
ncbi:MAG: DUF1934 domain-containing protein [Oscillospiraceae bacterium]|nr:DUF1934 domain-containing protein [Oscillospiraceae bacterium]